MPSRDELIAFIGGSPAPNGEKPPARVTKRDIARAFGVKGEAKTELKLLIKDLQNEGAIARGRKALQVQGRLPAIVVADIAERDRDGELVAKPVEWDEEGPPPRILIRRPRTKRDSAPAPGLGARVLIRVEFNPDATGKAPAYSGRVIKVLEKLRARMFAVFRRAEDGSGRALPVEKRSATREFFIPAAFADEAEDGDLVAIEPLRATRSRRPDRAHCGIDRLGQVRKGGEPDRARSAPYSVRLFASRAKRGRNCPPGSPRISARGLAVAAARDDRSPGRQGPRRRGPRRG